VFLKFLVTFIRLVRLKKTLLYYLRLSVKQILLKLLLLIALIRRLRTSSNKKISIS
jgi:hypothetical protein